MDIRRLSNNPIVFPRMKGLDGKKGSNINGPSLLKVPKWVKEPFGKYYLYFGHHQGKYIRLAYSENIEGPYKIYRPGSLNNKYSWLIGPSVAGIFNTIITI